MPKRPNEGHDATQELSTSQLVVPPRPVPSSSPPGVPTTRPVLSRNAAQNDMSVWGHVVVGTDDFAPAPKRMADGGKRTKLLIIGGGALVAGVLAAVFLVAASGDSKPASKVPAAAPSPTPAEGEKHVMVVTPDPARSGSAGSAAVAGSAAGSASERPAMGSAAIAAGSAAAPTVAAVAEVDAISGVAPVIRPSKKVAKATKKPIAKKKPPAKKKP